MATQINEPTIATMTAEINVIKIGNKQMTKAVFNQIKRGYVLSDDLTLKKDVFIWGTINIGEGYIIFSEDNELRKQITPYFNRLEFVYNALNYLEGKGAFKNLSGEVKPLIWYINDFQKAFEDGKKRTDLLPLFEYWTNRIKPWLPKSIEKKFNKLYKNHIDSLNKIYQSPQIFIAV